MDALANNIPLIRCSGFLEAEECNAMLDILKTHKIVSLSDPTHLTCQTKGLGEL